MATQPPGVTSSVEQHVSVVFKHSLVNDEISNSTLRVRREDTTYHRARRSPYRQYIRTAHNPGDESYICFVSIIIIIIVVVVNIIF